MQKERVKDQEELVMLKEERVKDQKKLAVAEQHVKKAEDKVAALQVQLEDVIKPETAEDFINRLESPEHAPKMDVPEIVQGMVRHTANNGAQTKSLTAIHRLVAKNPKRSRDVFDAGGIEPVCEAIQQHSTDIEVLDAAFDALHVLVKLGPRANKNAEIADKVVNSLGVVARILAGMDIQFNQWLLLNPGEDGEETAKYYEAWSFLQESGCTTLHALLKHPGLKEEVKQKIKDSGGVHVLTKSLVAASSQETWRGITPRDPRRQTLQYAEEILRTVEETDGRRRRRNS